MQRVAHTIKGALSHFGAREAVARALRLELMGREGNLADAAGACADLEAELQRAEQVLAEGLQVAG